MTIWEFLAAAALAAIGGGAGAALVTGLHDRWRFRAERKAKREDREEARSDQTAAIAEQNKLQEERLMRLEKQVDALVNGQRSIMLDRVIYLGQAYVCRGNITYEERKRLRDMHSVYHNDLGGNGDADLIMASVDALPLSGSVSSTT